MHDLTKGGSFKRPKKSNLDSDNFHRVLRCLGFECLKRQSVEFESKDEILTVLEQCKEFCKDLSFSTADFLEDLLTTVPIFALDGHYYKWSHRSLQEYFAAQFIFKDSKDKQSEVLNNIYQHSEINYYLGTLELYADMDPTSFRKIIEYSFLKEFIKHYDKCCEVTIPGVKKEEFEKRIFLTFMSEFFIIQDSKKELTAESYKDADLDSRYINKKR